jgi:protein-L-isoaspartate(D-aspartate) O-methyltransferase
MTSSTGNAFDDEMLVLQQSKGWHHATLTFPGGLGMTAEAAAVLSASLELAVADGDIVGYHFLRKSGTIRLRVAGDDERAEDRFTRVLDTLANRKVITAWVRGNYEPEVLAFGGPDGMDAAHDLFCVDSRYALAAAGRADDDKPGAQEKAVLLLSTLIRTAGQDWFETADVWAKVAALRPPTTPPDGGRFAEARAAMRTLMTTDAAVLEDVEPGWSQRVQAFDDSGRRLRELSDDGDLGRGLRAVLAHHAIFTLNRAGVPADKQAALAHLAKQVVFASPDVSQPGESDPADSVGQMETTLAPNASDEAAELREQLVRNLTGNGTLRSPRIEEAFAAIERHKFVPEATLADAYADDAVTIKRAVDGIVISAASQPTVVATMLEQLDPQPGEKIMEAGAATGYNAALIGHLVAPGGHVHTIDVDQDLIDGANAHLAAAGVDNVVAVLGDGAAGLPEHAPFDRIVFTVGAGDVPTAVLDQLAPAGRLLIPLRIRGGVSRAIAFERDGNRWVSVSSEMATFMPLRKGIADDERVITALTPDGAVTLHTYAEQNIDPAGIAAVLDNPGREAFTGVKFRKGSTWEWLNLWLTCALPGGLSRMPATGPLVDSGELRPQFPWGAMAAVDRDTIAYLTMREGADQDGRFWEAGVIGHGPHAATLADATAAQIQAWADGHRDTIPTIRLANGPRRDRLTGRFVIDKLQNRIALDWD